MVVGHKKQWESLRKAVKSSRLSHAYLFFGEDELGKKTLALEFAKLLNCQHDDEALRPCQACRNCLDIQRGIHPDVISIKTEDKEIKISAIRDLQSVFSLKPHHAEFKVAVIDDAHLMNEEAQGAFLKFLEEPSPKTVLILITPYPAMLYGTILSRVEKIRFFFVSDEEIKKLFAQANIPEELRAKIIEFSDGKPGRAAKFISDPSAMVYRQKLIEDFSKLIESDLSFRFKYAENISQNPQELRRVLEVWLRYLRNEFIKRLRPQIPGVKAPLCYYSPAQLKKIIQLLHSIEFFLITTNVNPRLALERFFLEL